MKIIKNFLLKGKHHKPIVIDVFYNMADDMFIATTKVIV